MNALILAAGFGTRMKELTRLTPKPLLPLGDTTLIERNIALLHKAGITNIVINTHYLGEQIIAHLQAYNNLTFTTESQILESGGGIINALPHLDDEFIVINADIVTDFDISTLERGSSLAQLVLVHNPEHNPSGDFEHHGQMLTFSGIGLYSKALFQSYEVANIRLASIIREHIHQISFTHYQGIWYDIGTPERLHYVQNNITKL